MDRVELSAFERTTREKLEAYRMERGDAMTTSELVASLVFRAMYSMSLSAERIVTVANAIQMEVVVSDLQPALTRMVKAKVLRSRKNTLGGVRVYEVNF